MECEEIERTFPSSFKLVPHNVSGIPATLWLTMWTEREEVASLNEDPLCLCNHCQQLCIRERLNFAFENTLFVC